MADQTSTTWNNDGTGDGAEAADAPGTAREADRSEVVCRICFDGPTPDVPDNAMLSPCMCSGSMAYCHRQCLDEWRMASFEVKAITHCTVCGFEFKVKTPEAEEVTDAAGEVRRRLIRFVSIRVGLLLASIILLGFVPNWLLGGYDLDTFAFFGPNRPILNHLTCGSLSTLSLTGAGVLYHSILTVNTFINPFRFLGGGRGRSGRRERDSDGMIGVLILLCAVGALWILWHIARGVWEIVWGGRGLLKENLKNLNKEMRCNIVKKYRVLNSDGSEPTEDKSAPFEEAEQEARQEDVREALEDQQPRLDSATGTSDAAELPPQGSENNAKANDGASGEAVTEAPPQVPQAEPAIEEDEEAPLPEMFRRGFYSLTRALIRA